MNSENPGIPIATYRLQFNSQFRFSHASEIVPYLHTLGISDIYASPYFKASEGSLHGYDVLDQNRLNPEIGTEEEFDALVDELKKYGMGQILDIVPNHMCIEGQGNALWMDVLENGPSAHYAGFFDINWHPLKKELNNKILIPILGDQFGAVLENGELTLSFEEGSFFIHYYHHKLPLIPKTYSTILMRNNAALEADLGNSNPQFQELASIVTALGHLPPTTEMDPALVVERYQEKVVLKRRLRDLYETSREIRELIDGNVTAFNGVQDDPRSFDLLEALLLEQVYRLAHWRVATEEINYRRFFDINSLGAICVEDPLVFEETHQLVLSLVASGKINGLRIDHADGLLDPEAYFIRLQSRIAAEFPSGKPLYVIAEKILIKAEKLPDSWPVNGTTGYDFAIQVNGLFIDTANAKQFDSLYTRFVQHRIDFQDVIHDKKKIVMQVAMSSEINMLGYYLNRISEQNRHTRDFTLNSLTKSIVDVIAHFPVYRTYINSFETGERDRHCIESAVSGAKRKNPAISASVFDFIEDVLLLRFPQGMSTEDKNSWLYFVKRFQQISGPVMAKGVEDSAFYVYNRLLSLNEVGGSPDTFGISMEEFHTGNIGRHKVRPLAMLATSTHDTKRSEDVRARINVLSEMPEQWRKGLSRWNRQNRTYKKILDDKVAPDRNEEYLLYQTLVGTWPFCRPEDDEFTVFRSRIKGYMVKALREAKVHTSWISPNQMYEDAVTAFVDSILTKHAQNKFFEDFYQFQKMTAACGIFNSLSQTLLKITSPGIPDIYQGNELWDFSLVDPDNRRPVDFALRKKVLAEIAKQDATVGLLETARHLVDSRSDGLIKLHLTYKALNYRRNNRELFESGSYLPLAVTGALAEHICAFERSLDNSSILVVAPRFCSSLIADSSGVPVGQETWRDTRIMLPHGSAARSYRNIVTGEIVQTDQQMTLAVSDVLSVFPVALMERSGAVERMGDQLAA
jgi:(1->4)-alpha-D-glucan 1-alpha-D-glucosylmutase